MGSLYVFNRRESSEPLAWSVAAASGTKLFLIDLLSLEHGEVTTATRSKTRPGRRFQCAIRVDTCTLLIVHVIIGFIVNGGS
jgi:hypothetical protein